MAVGDFLGVDSTVKRNNGLLQDFVWRSVVESFLGLWRRSSVVTHALPLLRQSALGGNIMAWI